MCLVERLLGIIVLCCCLSAGNVWAQRPVFPEDLSGFGTVSDPRLSPAGDLVAYVVSHADTKQNKIESEIWLARADGGGEPRQLTDATQSSRSPRWSPDGRWLAFLSTRPSSGVVEGAPGAGPKQQVYQLPLAGGEAQRLTNLRNGVRTFSWSPDGTRLVCVSASGPSVDNKPAQRSDSRHYIHPTYKLDGQGFFDDKRDHLWVITVATGKANQITDGDDWDDRAPAWSPDGSRIAFFSDRTSRYWEDLGNSLAGVWIVAPAGGKPIRIGENASWLASGAPVWSPDGAQVAYFGGVPSYDPRQIMLAPSSGNGATKTLVSDLDLSVADLKWAENGRALYFVSNVRGEQHLFRVEAGSGRIAKITSGSRWVREVDINDRMQRIAFVVSRFERPSELYVALLDGSSEKTISHVNDALLRSLKLQPMERLSFKVADGFDVDGFLVKPAGWEPGRKYPMILYIHGGPQGMYGTNWMLSAQVLAAHGWSVLLTNPRGSTGYGSKFMKAAEKEWGGKIYTDLMSGVDAVLAKNDWIDSARLGVTGCSFGGFMTNWIITQTTRFRAAVPMCSISNFISDEGTRDDYYGHAHEFGGDLYENFNLYWKYSPVRYAMNVKTPTLILHGEADQRVPIEQAEQWFRALRHFRVPSELVIFPREFHGGLSNGEPKHVVEVMNWQVYWFDRYLNHTVDAVPPDLAPAGGRSSDLGNLLFAQSQVPDRERIAYWYSEVVLPLVSGQVMTPSLRQKSW